VDKWLTLGKASEISIGQSKLFEIEGRIVSVFHLKEGWFALDDRCPHRGGPLGEGRIQDGCVICPWHHAQFEIASGHCLQPRTLSSVKSYPVRVSQENIEVELP